MGSYKNTSITLIFDPRMGLFDRCFKGKKDLGEEESCNDACPPAAPSTDSQTNAKPMNPRQTMIERSPSEEDEIARMYQARLGNGRKSVSAERYDPTEDDLDMPTKIVPKSDKQRKRLRESTAKIMLLNRLDEEQLHTILDAMEERSVSEGEIVIQQGDDGDNFYIIEKGDYEIIIGSNSVGKYEGTGSFGELALMYNTPRAATIKAITSGTLWSLDRQTFRQIIVKANAIKRKQYEEFLGNVDILENINDFERAKIADVMETKKFGENEIIIKQGDTIDSSSFVYFLMAGTVAVTISDTDGTQKEVKRLEKGSYFGELALLTKEPRKATCKVVSGDATVGVLDVNAFERLLGPCKELMSRKIDHYAEEIANLNNE